MNPFTALRAHLMASPEVSTAVGGSRIYPVQLPQAPILPAVRIFRVSGERPHSTEGALGQINGRYQIDCYARTFSEADALSELIRKHLDGYKGPVGAGDYIQGAFFQTERDFWEDQPTPGMYVASRDYNIWFREDVG